MALAIAIHACCDGCVASHVHDCLRAGATREELLETVGGAVLMGGAPSLVHGAEVLGAIEQFGAGPSAAEPVAPTPTGRLDEREVAQGMGSGLEAGTPLRA